MCRSAPLPCCYWPRWSATASAYSATSQPPRSRRPGAARNPGPKRRQKGKPGIRDRAGLTDVRLHDLRHTTGTYAGAAGLNAFIVRDLLGHKTLAMTGRYVTATPTRCALRPMRVRTNRRRAQWSGGQRGADAEGGEAINGPQTRFP